MEPMEESTSEGHSEGFARTVKSQALGRQSENQIARATGVIFSTGSMFIEL